MSKINTNKSSVEGNITNNAEKSATELQETLLREVAECEQILASPDARKLSPEARGELKAAADVGRRAAAAMDKAAEAEGGMANGLRRLGRGFVARVQGFARRIWNFLKQLVGLLYGLLRAAIEGIYELCKFLILTLWGAVRPAGYETTPEYASV